MVSIEAKGLQRPKSAAVMRTLSPRESFSSSRSLSGPIYVRSAAVAGQTRPTSTARPATSSSGKAQEQTPRSASEPHRRVQRPQSAKHPVSSHRLQNSSERIVREYREQAASANGGSSTVADGSTEHSFPVAIRSLEERRRDPERVQLDRQNLDAIPTLEYENNVRLLNLQNNSIRKIENVGHLRSLIFLDLYNNNLTSMEGLSELVELRVLMLGRNNIEHISGLQGARHLDVLDLHGNQIEGISGLRQAYTLRVLNLADNRLRVLHGIGHLTALAELNVRKNMIEEVESLQALVSLQRLFFSSNKLSSLQSLQAITDAHGLTELSLESNPVTEAAIYREHVLTRLPALRYLDAKRITAEERRLAAATMQRENERLRLERKSRDEAQAKEATIESIRRTWENAERNLAVHAQGARGFTGKAGEETPPARRKATFHEPFPRSQHEGLVETKGETLLSYGTLPLTLLDHVRDALSNNITCVQLSFVRLHDIASTVLVSLRSAPFLRSLALAHNGIYDMNDLQVLAELPLSNLTITENPICIHKALLRKYAAFLFPEIGQFNGESVSAEHRNGAVQALAALRHSRSAYTRSSLHERNGRDDDSRRERHRGHYLHNGRLLAHSPVFYAAIGAPPRKKHRELANLLLSRAHKLRTIVQIVNEQTQ